MKVEVRLFATLAQYLPPNSKGNTASVDLPEEITVEALVARLGLSDDLPTVTLVNGLDATPGQRLSDGDVVSLFPPLSGG
ncbi:MAG: MoaD/ThiS family protein [Candidatus Rokubacteria bacterium]|nr:MoaD/ThiS family protein [Candidatus Rokubacteria bacterium]